VDPIASWSERLRTTLPAELRAVPTGTPAIELTSTRIGPIGCWRLLVSGVQGIRTAAHVAAHDPEMLALYLGVSGTPTLSCVEHSMRLAPGDLTVLSSSRPCGLTAEDRHEALVLCIPRALLEPHAARLEALAVRLCDDPVVRELVVPALTQLGAAAGSGDLGRADTDYGELVVSLAHAVSAPRHGADGAIGNASGARGSLLLSQAKDYIERHLRDPDLRPAEVAASQYISVRYLQKLFQAEGVTMLAWTRRARLGHARRDLADPTQGHRTIAEIAASWGFRHPGHFRRAFRDEYGGTPARFRREMLHGA
jgi:AraC-like DNA-binding protein